MPHINHRRNERRRWAKKPYGGWWNRYANRNFRSATRRVLRDLIREQVTSEDVLFPLQDEVDDYWSFD